MNSSPVGDMIASSSVDGTIRLWIPSTGECSAVLKASGPYDGMNITDVTGVSQTQHQALLDMGAIDTSLTAKAAMFHRPITESMDRL